MIRKLLLTCCFIPGIALGTETNIHVWLMPGANRHQVENEVSIAVYRSGLRPPITITTQKLSQHRINLLARAYPLCACGEPYCPPLLKGDITIFADDTNPDSVSFASCKPKPALFVPFSKFGFSRLGRRFSEVLNCLRRDHV